MRLGNDHSDEIVVDYIYRGTPATAGPSSMPQPSPVEPVLTPPNTAQSRSEQRSNSWRGWGVMGLLAIALVAAGSVTALLAPSDLDASDLDAGNPNVSQRGAGELDRANLGSGNLSAEHDGAAEATEQIRSSTERLVQQWSMGTPERVLESQCFQNDDFPSVDWLIPGASRLDWRELDIEIKDDGSASVDAQLLDVGMAGSASVQIDLVDLDGDGRWSVCGIRST